MKACIQWLPGLKRSFARLVMAALVVAVLLAASGSAQQPSTTVPTKVAKVNEAPEADKIHLILTGLVSGPASDIGADCRSDLVAIQQMFTTAFSKKTWRARLELHTLYGEAWTGPKILEHLRTAKIGPNDNVVFCQAGHGGILNADQPIATHKLQVGVDQWLYRSQVRDALLHHQCRGFVILTDCCSGFPVPQKTQSRNAADNMPEPPRLNPETVHYLFLRFRGLVDITAAEIGVNAANISQLGSFGEARGAFTTAFLRAACEQQVHRDWRGFFSQLQQATHASSGGRHRACALLIRENQTPQGRPMKFPGQDAVQPSIRLR